MITQNALENIDEILYNKIKNHVILKILTFVEASTAKILVGQNANQIGMFLRIVWIVLHKIKIRNSSNGFL